MTVNTEAAPPPSEPNGARKHPRSILNPDDDDYLLTPSEVGAIFRVDAKTVTRWALNGRIPQEAILRTPGNHIRIRQWAVKRAFQKRG